MLFGFNFFTVKASLTPACSYLSLFASLSRIVSGRVATHVAIRPATDESIVELCVVCRVNPAELRPAR
ncbi:MAG: hypothetical protein L6Q76_24540, partial [Polyangiaceae bacterium]|nr:hypothetical protein [Polyangiaceae bacterium]